MGYTEPVSVQPIFLEEGSEEGSGSEGSGSVVDY